tara:strand:+ start:3117 stop:4505 length:1389 start_codon:yes stop_codon:yes gene_type:complete
MVIRKKDINKIFILFLFAHIIVWTLVPTLTNNNLPLDTIEALAWGNELKMGYQKHPPLSAWFLEFFYTIFKNQDWAYYFLSQLFVISSFIIIFKFSGYFFNEKIYSLLSVLILEGIYFYNFTTPEFNVNVCQLPFWSLTVYYCWKGIEKNDSIIWLIFGSVAALGVLSKYLFIYLLIGIDIFFIYLIITRKFNSKVFISLISFFLILTPHIFWLINNDYSTINYAIFRSVNDPLSGFESTKFLNHIIYPLIFLGKQIGILIPFLIMLYFIVSRFKFKINYKDKKFLFLISVTVLPIMLVLITSLITGARIRTMGMTPFYLFSGVLIIYLFKNKINLKKLKNFLIIFLILFITSPSTYYFISSSKNNERTDYPGKKIAQIINEEWKKNFSGPIKIAVGFGWIDGWYAQNLSYHLKERPIWKDKLKNEPTVGTVWIRGYNEIKDCVGILYKIKPYNDVCMLGKK